MQKNIFKISIILLTLNTTGCVQRTIQTSNQEIIPQRQHIPIAQDTPVQDIPVIANTSTFHNRQIIQATPIQTREEVVYQQPIAPPPVNIAPSTSGESHSVRTVQGTTLTIQERSNGFVFPQYQDKVVLLEIFGKECPYCFKEIPLINNLYSKYRNNLQVIALQAQEPMTKHEASTLMQRHQMNYPVIDKDEAVPLLLFIQNTYGWTGILPYTLIIKNGVTEFSFTGEVSHQELDEAMRSLI